MSQRFLQPQLASTDLGCEFDQQESNHLTKVLRKRVGDIVEITNGKGDLFEGVIVDSHPKRSKVKLNFIKHESASKAPITIALGVPKSTDRFEWFLEKATEIGIDHIIPLQSRFSERKSLNYDRSLRIIESAFKQSLRLHIPKLSELSLFEAVLEQGKEYDQLFIGHCYPSEQKPDLSELIETNRSKIVLIGPEGDFSEEEVTRALDAGFRAISLGQQRLRTETAGLMALARMVLSH